MMNAHDAHDEFLTIVNSMTQLISMTTESPNHILFQIVVVVKHIQTACQ